MSFETLEMEVADGIAVITINRPDQANALNEKMASELFEASIRCGEGDVRAVVVTARGKLFCAGGDLAEFHAQGDGQSVFVTRMATMMHAAIARFATIDAPVIMAVNGTAGGGGFSIALSGDIIIASERAKFVSAYTASGLTPDGSSTYFLAKYVGLLRAKELMLTNRVLSAEEAMDWGMVSKVVPAEALMEEAMTLARSFAAGPTAAYGGVKRLAATMFSDTLETQLDRETRSIAAMMNTHDGPHGNRVVPQEGKAEVQGGVR